MTIQDYSGTHRTLADSEDKANPCGKKPFERICS